MVVNIREGTADDGGFIIKNKVHITRRELEALALIGMGLNNNEAAKRLGVRVNTVRNHIWNLMQKLGANGRAHAIVLAVQNGIIEVKHERSLGTYVRGFDQYVLCILCGKAALIDDYKEVEAQNVVINHVEYEFVPAPKCPSEGCRGGLDLTLDWDTVRVHHPEYPEIPEHGVVYDYDIDWFRGYESE
jgi:DNA-binding CsgD family transcriptional regulator